MLADEFLCPAEAQVRNLRIGSAMARELGSFDALGYLPDTFGHAGSTPQLLRGFGIERALVWRGADPQASAVTWRGRDGRGVKTLVLPSRDGYFQVGLKGPGFARALDEFVRFHRRRCAVMLYLDGGDHTVCDADAMERVRAWADGSGVRVVEASMEEVCRALDDAPARCELVGELRDNAKIYVLSGTWSARVPLKAHNQRCAARLTHEMEFLAAWERDASDSRTLREALWKRFLTNQAHDGICGCGVDEVHRDNERRLCEIEQAVGELTESVLSRRLPFVYDDPATSNPHLYLLNPLPYPGRRFVETQVVVPLRDDRGSLRLLDESGAEVPLAELNREVGERFFHDTLAQPWYEDVVTYRLRFPMEFWGMEGRALRLEPCAGDGAGEAAPEAAGAHFAENELYRLEVRDGALAVLDKTSGTWHERQHVVRSSLDAGDTYTYAPPACDQLSEARVTAVRAERLPLTQRLVVDYEMDVPASLAPDRSRGTRERVVVSLRSTFTLDAGSALIVVETILDNRARDHRVTLSFDVGDCAAHASDGPLDWVRRGVAQPPRLPVGPGEESVSGMDPSATQIVAGELQLVHLGLHEYRLERDGRSSRCCVTLLRCVGSLSRRDLSTRGGGAGPSFATPDAQCPGVHRLTYGLVFGRASFSPAHALSLRAPVIARQSARGLAPERIVSVDPDVHVSSWELDGGRYWVHLFNHREEARRVTLTLGGAARAWRANLAHELLEPLCAAPARKVEVALGPGEIGCVAIEDWRGNEAP